MTNRTWILINTICAAVFCGWLGRIGKVDNYTLMMFAPLLIISMVWGIMQWVYLRHSHLNVTLLWPIASAISWAFAAPFTLLVVQIIPDHWQNFTNYYEGTIGNPDSPTFGLIGLLGAVIFYSLIAGFQSLPQHLLLWLRGKKDTSWAGVAGLGWSIGLSVGVAFMIFIAVLFSTLFDQAVPLTLPIRAAIVGGIAGLTYAIYIEIAELNPQDINELLNS